MTALVEANPFLVGDKPKPSAPNTNAAEDGGDKPMLDLTAEELTMAKAFGMTPEEYAANKSTQPVAATT